MSTNIVFSKSGGKNDPLYGKFEHPIKALIQNESNALEKKKTALDVLFNIEKSNRYAETIIDQTDFDTFQSASEGASAERDTYQIGHKKTIEHIAFMKEFVITKEMADDAKATGMGTNMRAKPKGFVRAYYKTRVKLGAWALANGTQTSGTFNKATVDLTTGDGKALFSNAHEYANQDKFPKATYTQSNYFYGDVSSADKLETALNKLANKMRNFKDENNETMEYVPDVIVLPCNRPELEARVKKVVGSERVAGSNFNDINTQYGNWTIVILPSWETTDDRFMLMSSEANKQLMGSMFYNRIALDVQSEIDIHTRNYVWNGYCRFGCGFSTWKHMLLAVGSTTAVTGATAI